MCELLHQVAWQPDAGAPVDLPAPAPGTYASSILCCCCCCPEPLQALVGRNFAHHPNLVQASAGLGAA